MSYPEQRRKVVEAVKSCETIDQIRHAGEMFNLLELRWQGQYFAPDHTSVRSYLSQRYHSILCQTLKPSARLSITKGG